MKLKLLILSLFIGFLAQAQTPLPGSTLVNARYQWLGGKFQQLKIPMYADTTQYPLWLPRVGGDMMLDTAGVDEGVIYVRYNMYWHGVSGNGGSSDTSGYKYFAAQYPLVLIGGGDTAYLSIDTAGLSGGGSVVLPYNNIDSLRLHTAASGQGASTLGYSAPGDGGAASYYWDAASTATDDSLLVIKVTGVTTGRWRQLIVNATVNPKTGGAKGDGATDDYWAVQRSFASAVANGYMVQFPKGTFMNSGTWVAPQNLVIRGSGNRQTIFRSTSDTILMTFTSSNLIEDIRFFGNNIGSTGLLFNGGNKAFINRCRFENFKWRGFANLNGQNSEFNNNFSQYNGYFNYWADGEENCIYTNCNFNSDETQNATAATIGIYNTNGNNSHWAGGLGERGPSLGQVYVKSSANISFTDMQINSGIASALALVDDATASFTRVQFSVPGYPAVNVRTIGSNAKSNISDCSTVGANGRTNKSLYDGLNLFNGNVRMPIYSSNLAGGIQGSAVGGGTLSFDTSTRTMIVRGTGSAMGIGIGAGSGSGTMAKGQRLQIQVYIPHISNASKELDLSISRATTPAQTFIKKIHEGYNDVIYTAPDSLSSMRIVVTQGLAVTGSFGLRSLELSFPGGRDSVGYEFDARTISPVVSQEFTPAADTAASGGQLFNAGQTKELIEGRKQWRDTTGGIYNNTGTVTVGLLNSSSTAKFRINATTGVIESKGLFLSNAIASTLHQRDTTTAALIGTLKNRLFQNDRRIYLTTDSATVSDITGGNNTFIVYPRGYTYFNTVGGDLSNSVRNEFSFNKQAGFSGLSVLEGGKVNYDVVPVTLNYMTGYNGTNVNNYSLKGWWAGSASYIHMRQAYDSVEHWAGFYASGHNQFGTNNIKNAYGFYSTAIPGALNSWGVYSKDAILKNFMEGSLGIGPGNELPEANLDLSGTFKYVDGNQANGKVLTSDASGNATWQTASGGGGGGAAANTNLGSGYRLVVPATQEIKTLLAGAGILIDSTTTPGALIVSITASGNVNTGAANQLTYYAGSGTTVSPLTAITASRALASNASGLPVAATTTSTELGYVNGVTSAIQTQINTKRPLTGQTSVASSATPTPVGSVVDNQYFLTAQAAAAAFAAPSGAPINGNTLMIRIRDDGTARALTWNSIYTAGLGFTLPTTTVVGEDMYVQFIYNSSGTPAWQLTGVRSSTAIGPWMLATGGINYIGGNVGINQSSPTARLHLPAGTSSSGTAPLKFSNGPLMTVPENGAMEATTHGLHYTSNFAGQRGTVQVIRANVTISTVNTIIPYQYSDFVYIGTATATWTLPAINSSTDDYAFEIKNSSAFNLTLNTNAGGNDIFTTTSVNTLTIVPGQLVRFISGPTKFYVK